MLYFKKYSLFLRPVTKIKKFHVLRESGNVSKKKCYIQRVHFYDEYYLYQASKLKPMLSINKAIYVEYNLCYRNYACQVSKLQHICVIGLILLSVLETTKQTRLYQI